MQQYSHSKCDNCFLISKRCKINKDIWLQWVIKLTHPVFNKVEHILIIQQPDKMEGAKTCSRSQCKITDDHAGVERPVE